MQKRKYTYKLYPNAKQQEQLIECLRLHQQLYNAALQERIDCYKKTGRSISYNDQQSSLTQIRSEHEEYEAIPCTSSRMTLRRLDKAFKSFFKRVKKGETPGFPRFKSLKRFSSFDLLDTTFIPNENWKHGKLFIRGIGHIKARGQARVAGKVKTSQVRLVQGHWELSLTVECDPSREATATKAVGIDWGVEHLLTLTHEDGTTKTVSNSRYYKNTQAEMLPLEQSIAGKKRLSNRWRAACAKLSKAKAKVARQRKDDQHKISKEIAADYTLVATEKLKIKNMTGSAKGDSENPGKNVKAKSGLNREILDTAPAQLLGMIRYKVEETGGEYVEAPTRKLKPSQRCPSCWAIRKKKLSERQHSCDCGLSMGRDSASAWVMLKWALGLGQELA